MAVLEVQVAGMRYELNDALAGRIKAIEEAHDNCFKTLKLTSAQGANGKRRSCYMCEATDTFIRL